MIVLAYISLELTVWFIVVYTVWGTGSWSSLGIALRLRLVVWG